MAGRQQQDHQDVEAAGSDAAVALTVRQHWDATEARNLRRAIRRSQREGEDAEVQRAAAASLLLQHGEDDGQAEEDLARARQISLLECDEQEVRRAKEESLRSAYQYLQAQRAAGAEAGADDDETVVSGSGGCGDGRGEGRAGSDGGRVGYEGGLAGGCGGSGPHAPRQAASMQYADHMASQANSQRTTRQHPADTRSQRGSIHHAGDPDTERTASTAQQMQRPAEAALHPGDAARQHWQSSIRQPANGVPGSEIPLISPRGRPAALPRAGHEASPAPAHPDLPSGQAWTMPPRRPSSPAATLHRVWTQREMQDRQRRELAEKRWGPGYNFDGVRGDDESERGGPQTARQNGCVGEAGAHRPGTPTNVHVDLDGCGRSSQAQANLDGYGEARPSAYDRGRG